MGRTDINQAAIRALPRDPAMRKLLLDLAQPVVRRAQTTAPRLTGAGAASIHAEAALDRGQWEARIGWDRRHAYLRFQEFGTRRGVEAKHFLVRALQTVNLRKGVP